MKDIIHNYRLITPDEALESNHPILKMATMPGSKFEVIYREFGAYVITIEHEFERKGKDEYIPETDDILTFNVYIAPKKKPKESS